MTSASLNSRTAKDLADMARRRGVNGWHSMRKEQLVRALLQLAAKAKKAKSRQRPSAKPSKIAVPVRRAAAKGKPAKTFVASSNAVANAKTVASGKTATSSQTATSGKTVISGKTVSNGKLVSNNKLVSKAPLPPAKPPRDAAALARLAQAKANLERARNLANADDPIADMPTKERVVVMVRGPFWLHVYWEVTRAAVERARAALSQDWHSARPVLRLFERAVGQSADSVERVVRDVPIHGGVNDWYIDVNGPPKTFRVEIGYVVQNGALFHSLGRSNIVTTPRAGKRGPLDDNWLEVAADYDRIYAMSGGYETEGDNSELRTLFEERLKRPLGSPMVTRFGSGARMLPGDARFEFDVDAQMVVFGTTRPDAYVTLRGEPIRIREDGTFSVRLALPDAREVIPIVASSCDGVEQRTVILSIDRNTKVLEPVIRDVGQ